MSLYSQEHPIYTRVNCFKVTKKSTGVAQEMYSLFKCNKKSFMLSWIIDYLLLLSRIYLKMSLIYIQDIE